MQTYICKCGKTFEKSTNAATTGYAINDYSPEHECYGCPYIVTEPDWQTKGVVKHLKRECRATPKITYLSRCCIRTEKGDFSSCKLYSLDLVFVREVLNYVNSLDGAEKITEFSNCIPDKWRAADFGQCYSFDDCFGLAVFDLSFKKNKKGTEARRLVKERFFYEDGTRRDMTEKKERETILVRIQIAKENAGNKTIAVEQAAEKTEVTTMSKFNINAMLGAPAAVMPEQYTQAAQLHAEIINCAKTAQENLYQMAMGFKKMRDEKLYTALGYDNFGDYCEQGTEMSRRSVYNYITVVEKLPQEFVQRLHKFETKKLLMLTEVSEENREEIIETTDLESTTVKELKARIKELEVKTAAADKASEANKKQLAKRDEEINRLKGENIKLQGRSEKSDKIKEEKERLEQLLKEAEKRAKEQPETQSDPKDKEKIASLEAQVKELESRPIDVVYEKDDEEINRLKEKIAELQQELEAENGKAESDIKVFAVRLTADDYDELVSVIGECGNESLKNAVMNAQVLNV